ncbi:hypothetical protein LSH36_137g03052 [Paralvinella palmiformis]|uniref:Uncharacterized protein n=1 Tax=Paralvinella palmiformis TaxID=53620 RepID=A0AAD9N7R1_9ANNE|nr:hypothetical protein LSH36_137g03052 [Paralvinella palmiformis]
MTRALIRVGPRIYPCGRPVSVGCSLGLESLEGYYYGSV